MTKPATPTPRRPRAKAAATEPKTTAEIESPDAEPASSDGEAMAAVREMADAAKRWSPNARQLATGAAIGVGSAAVVAALLYWRGSKK